MDRERRVGSTLLLDAVADAVTCHGLLAPGDRVLVAVSGGPDSVALLHALTRLAPGYGLVLGVCHVDHGLRPEAARDTEFVRRLAEGLDCPVMVERVVVPRGEGRSPEDAARAARYAALARAARAFGARRIALGHTADDQVETVLMRLLQGAGPRGLAGIPVRRGRLVRPLLAVDRATVLTHLATHGLPFVEDATNRDPKFLRNRIRHELLPLLAAQGGPRIGAALCRTARACRETVEALDALLAPQLAGVLRREPVGWAIEVADLDGLPPGAVKSLLRLAIRAVAPSGDLAAGLRATHLTALFDLLAAAPGARVRLSRGLVVERARTALWIVPRTPRPDPAALPVPGEITLTGSAVRLVADTPAPPAGRQGDPAEGRPEVWLDADLLMAGLEVRPAAPADRIVPFGGDRAVRVRRLLAAAGTPRVARPAWPILVSRPARGDGEVLWVIGVRRGAAAPVTSETRTAVRVRIVADRPVSPTEELS